MALSHWINCTDRHGNPLPESKRPKCNQYRALKGLDPLPEMTTTRPAPIGLRKSAPVERKNVELKVLPWMTCPYRGEEAGKIGCGTCSLDKRIFPCSHPENAGRSCVKRCPKTANRKFIEEVAEQNLLVCEQCSLCPTEE